MCDELVVSITRSWSISLRLTENRLFHFSVKMHESFRFAILVQKEKKKSKCGIVQCFLVKKWKPPIISPQSSYLFWHWLVLPLLFRKFYNNDDNEKSNCYDQFIFPRESWWWFLFFDTEFLVTSAWGVRVHVLDMINLTIYQIWDQDKRSLKKVSLIWRLIKQ